MNSTSCFGYYNQSAICDSCAMQRKCKSMLVSDGFRVVAGALAMMLETLSDEAQYRQTPRVSETVDQLLVPPSPISKEEKELVGFLGSSVVGTDELDVDFL